MVIIRQFEVWLVELSPTLGSEINKARPCLVISPNSMNKLLNTVIIAPLTHTIKKYPSRVDCSFKGEAEQIVLDQIRSVDKVRLAKKLGLMNSETNENACTILQVMFQYMP